MNTREALIRPERAVAGGPGQAGDPLAGPVSIWNASLRGAHRVKALLPLLAVGAAVAAAPAVFGQGPAELLDTELELIRSRYGLPGLTAMAVKRGHIVGLGAAGVRRHGSGYLISTDDLINIGSCTKWMTATLAGRLVDRGIIAWNTRIRDVFPNHPVFDTAYLDVTLEELLAHRAGVPEGVVWEQRHRSAFATRGGTIGQLRRWVADVTLSDRPQVARGTELYSNQGYTVAAVMLELLTGKSWETLMEEEIFFPLGMTSARIGSSYDANQSGATAVFGHDQSEPGAAPIPRAPLPGPDLARYQASNGPGGLVICSLRDWARFLHRHALDGAGFLRAETALKLRTPFAGDEGYALGVGAFNRAFAAPGKALNHNGDILGETSLFWLAPEHDLMLLAFTNTAARGSASAEGRSATASLLLARYRDASLAGPHLDSSLPPAPDVVVPPRSRSADYGGTAEFSVAAVGTGPLGYEWRRNGTPMPGEIGPSIALSGLEPSDTGIYTVLVASSGGATSGRSAILGLHTDRKLVGSGTEFGNIFHHGTGYTYDQILLEGTAASATADPGQILRISFVDLNNDIVQVEFSGAGTLSLVLDGVTGPALPLSYVQDIRYMKGHAGIVVTGANASSHLSIFSVGRANAANPSLFRPDVSYDGVADLAFVAIASDDGRFGSLRTANGSYFAANGLTGIYAPGVEFTGPVFIGDISASGDATPVLVLGSAADVRITGGDLFQTNDRPVEASGVTELRFTAGMTSHGTVLPGQKNRSRIEENGVDVTDRIVRNSAL